MYERRRHPLLTRTAFAWRLARHAALAAFLMALSLGVGMVGYEHYEQWGWRQAFLNSAMLLGGMGPVDTLHTTAGKLFASFYALYSGMVFLVAVGIIFAPVFHRILHRFHLESGADDSANSSES